VSINLFYSNKSCIINTKIIKQDKKISISVCDKLWIKIFSIGLSISLMIIALDFFIHWNIYIHLESAMDIPPDENN